jgi:hypothetical protein
MLNVVMLNVVMLSSVMLSSVMLSVIMLSVIMLSVVMLSVIMLSVFMLSVFMLSIIVFEYRYAECHFGFIEQKCFELYRKLKLEKMFKMTLLLSSNICSVYLLRAAPYWLISELDEDDLFNWTTNGIIYRLQLLAFFARLHCGR